MTSNSRLLLALDLSTVSTGWALFDLDTKALLKYGRIEPRKIKGVSKLGYPKSQLARIRDMAEQLRDFIGGLPALETILIEEVNRGIGRIPQKTLSGFHYLTLDRMGKHVDLVKYKDSDGKTGWRTDLGLRLSDLDKKLNDERRKLNRKAGRGQKVPLITKKDLAQNFVNRHYGTRFDVVNDEGANDIVDAIGLGHAYLMTRMGK